MMKQLQFAILLVVAAGTGCLDDAPEQPHEDVAAAAVTLIHDDLQVDGSLEVGDAVQVHGYATFDFPATFTQGAVFAGELDGAGSLSVQGDVYRLAVHTTTVPGWSASGGANTRATSGLGVAVGWGLSASPFGAMADRAVVYQINGLTVGDQIRAWRLLVDKHTYPWTCTVNAQMYRFGGPYDESHVGGLDNAALQGEQWIGDASMQEPVLAGYVYYVVVTGCGFGADAVYQLAVDTNRPRA